MDGHRSRQSKNWAQNERTASGGSNTTPASNMSATQAWTADPRPIVSSRSEPRRARPSSMVVERIPARTASVVFQYSRPGERTISLMMLVTRGGLPGRSV